MSQKINAHFTLSAAGFSLIELMLCVLMISILASFAVPSYQAYLERKDLAEAKQYLLRISSELERFKARNYSYLGFDLADLYPSYDAVNNQLLLPIGTSVEQANYVITLVDLDSKNKLNLNVAKNTVVDSNVTQSVIGLNWVMKAERRKDSSGEMKQPNNYDVLINSKGLRCMTKNMNVVSSLDNCGTTQSELW